MPPPPPLRRRPRARDAHRPPCRGSRTNPAPCRLRRSITSWKPFFLSEPSLTRGPAAPESGRKPWRGLRIGFHYLQAEEAGTQDGPEGKRWVKSGIGIEVGPIPKRLGLGGDRKRRFSYPAVRRAEDGLFNRPANRSLPRQLSAAALRSLVPVHFGIGAGQKIFHRLAGRSFRQ